MTGNAVMALDEPVQWGVLMLYDGEVLGNARVLYPSEAAARARAAELRRRYPRHEIRLIRRTVVWTEESPGVAARLPVGQGSQPLARRSARAGRWCGTAESG
jgi:hypothetical protein